MVFALAPILNSAAGYILCIPLFVFVLSFAFEFFNKKVWMSVRICLTLAFACWLGAYLFP